MKKYIVTVNGKAYDVMVEEVLEAGAPVDTQPVEKPRRVEKPPVAPTPTPTATPTPKTTPKASKPVSDKDEKITAPIPGVISKILVKEGDAVKKGQAVAIIEAMKMETEIITPFAGTISAIVVNQSANVNSGDLLLTVALR